MNRNTLIAAIVTIAAFCGTAQAAERQADPNWIFRGDANLSGVHPSQLPDKLEPLWVFEAQDSIESTPAISGDTVLAASLDGFLYAVDLATGLQKWKYEAGEEIKTSPTVYRGTVFFGDGGGRFHAVDLATGKLKWQFEAEAEIVSSANYKGDYLVFGSHDQFLYCIKAADGKLVWKVETEGYVYGTPSIVGDQVISAGCDGYVRILKLSDGSELAPSANSRSKRSGYLRAMLSPMMPPSLQPTTLAFGMRN